MDGSHRGNCQHGWHCRVGPRRYRAQRGRIGHRTSRSFGMGPRPPDLSTVLRSHLLLHAAEGELYSEALADAAHAAGLPMVRYATKDVAAETAAALDCSPATVAEIAAKLGRGLGPPWAKDQKEAAMAALPGLHTVGRARRLRPSANGRGQ